MRRGSPLALRVKMGRSSTDPTNHSQILQLSARPAGRPVIKRRTTSGTTPGGATAAEQPPRPIISRHSSYRSQASTPFPSAVSTGSGSNMGTFSAAQVQTLRTSQQTRDAALKSLTGKACSTPGCNAAYFLVRPSGICWKCEADKDIKGWHGRPVVQRTVPGRRSHSESRRSPPSSRPPLLPFARAAQQESLRGPSYQLGSSLDGGNSFGNKSSRTFDSGGGGGGGGGFDSKPSSSFDRSGWESDDDEPKGGTVDSYLAPLRRAETSDAEAPEVELEVELEVEFAGEWLPAVQESANPWSTCFMFEDGSTAQVPNSHLQYRVRPLRAALAAPGPASVHFSGSAAIPDHLRYRKEDPSVRKARAAEAARTEAMRASLLKKKKNQPQIPGGGLSV